jgi:hypothetical protein
MRFIPCNQLARKDNFLLVNVLFSPKFLKRQTEVAILTGIQEHVHNKSRKEFVSRVMKC